MLRAFSTASPPNRPSENDANGSFGEKTIRIRRFKNKAGMRNRSGVFLLNRLRLRRDYG
jgi:hypothetical protein